MLTELANRAKMVLWAIKIERLVTASPGSNETFSPESLAIDATLSFSKQSIWGIICEEMLDTTHSKVYFQRALEELKHRGIKDEDYVEMRRFAWLTVGWMNFEMAAWEWCGLDANDIRHAIEWQHRDGWISAEEKEIRLAYVQKYEALSESR